MGKIYHYVNYTIAGTSPYIVNATITNRDIADTIVGLGKNHGSTIAINAWIKISKTEFDKLQKILSTNEHKD